MIGIYKYTNTINNKVYIGQSINIKKRQYGHIHSYKNGHTKDHGSRFHKAIRKHGFENFTFEVIHIIDEKDYNKAMLDELEIKYIREYDSFNFKKGYNATLGGDAGTSHPGEKNGRAKLTEKDVEHIREMYGNQVSFRKAFPLYEDRITKRGFQKIWWNDTWKTIKQEVYTEENKYFHKHQAKSLERDEVHNSIITSADIENMKIAKLEGILARDYYNSNFNGKMSYEGFARVWYKN